MKEFLGTFEAAKLCRVSPGTVARWIKDGKLKASVTAGGHRRIHRDDLVALMQSLRMPVPDTPALTPDLQVFIVAEKPQARTAIREFLESRFPGIRVEEKSPEKGKHDAA